ncbi:hypothetical protein RRG08_009255 [Elysia crispata]|uniref:Uncharacterized protein n=1 Tax=Elysia crispata TaxID=231223 RepID=A0AAE1AYK5_9GAST|nr:hypothetical protein RRG08_009255 [Elysia crispata]
MRRKEVIAVRETPAQYGDQTERPCRMFTALNISSARDSHARCGGGMVNVPRLVSHDFYNHFYRIFPLFCSSLLRA